MNIYRVINIDNESVYITFLNEHDAQLTAEMLGDKYKVETEYAWRDRAELHDAGLD